MKGLCILLMGISVFCFLPVDLCGQSLIAGNQTAGLDGPSFFGSGPCPQNDNITASKLFGDPNLYIGWLDSARGSTWSLQRQNSSGTASWPFRGLWLGASEEFNIGKGNGLLVSGSVLLPKRSAGTWYNSPAASTFDFEIPSYEWWAVDALVRGGLSGPFALLAGFRWDHTSTRVNYSDNSSDDYILNLYLPLVGAQLNQRFANGALLFRFLATPIVPGRVKYNFWDRLGFSEYGDFSVNRGYFMEIFSDYRFKITDDLSAGGFVKWNSVHVTTSERSLSGLATEPVSWTVDLRSWAVGGSLSLGFSSFL